MKIELEQILWKLLQTWKEELSLSGDVLFFLESVMGITSPVTLEHAVNDEEEQDRETILEMILFPGPLMRSALEPMLEPRGLTLSQIDFITQTLASNHPTLRMLHPGQTAPIVVQIPPDQVELFVSRLYLNKTLDPVICGALEKSFSTDIAMECRVMLRCHHAVFKGSNCQVLVDFIQKARDQKHQFTELFQFFLTIMSEAPVSGRIESYLLDRYNQEKKQLIEILKFEEKQARYSMDYLMMTGYQAPSDSLENVQTRLEKLDQIINDILCILPSIDTLPHPHSIDLGRFDPKNGIKDLLKRLS